MNHRNPSSPIYSIRKAGDIRWCLPLTRLDEWSRKELFNKCLQDVTGNTPQDENLRSVFRALAKYSYWDLLKMVGEKRLLAHCFNWEWYLKYQREYKKARHSEDREIGS